MDSTKGKCQVMKSWTFSELVGAFLDLVIAYLMLCGAAIAYSASRFLGFVGLGLPCPCNGLFWSPRAHRCLQKVLMDSPSERISAIQMSVRSKIPFDSMWAEARDQSQEPVHADLEGEASSSSVIETREKGCDSRYATPICSSVTETKEKGSASRYGTPINEMDDELHVWNSPVMMEERVYSKGKEVTPQRGRSALRRRGKRPAAGRKSSSLTSFDLVQLNVPDFPLSPFSLNMGSEKTNGSLEPITSVDVSEAPKDIGWQENDLGDSELSKAVEENKSERDAFASEQEDLALDCNDKNMIRILEQALEEERAVRTALYCELEKERTAAATATDEAMNMILRLQEEKAAVEMDARQYQRIIEAKFAYDEEEMNILKEILLRREREKHFLEKEIEAYRQIYFGNEQLDTDILDFQAMQGEWDSLHSNEDPMLVLQGISDSIDEKDKIKDTTDFAERDELRSDGGSTDNDVSFIEPKDHTLSYLGLDEVAGSSRPQEVHRQESISTDVHIGDDLEFQEKGMTVFMEENPFTRQMDAQRLEGRPESTGEPDLHTKGSGQGGMDSSSLVSDRESLLHDVIVTDDEITLNELSGKNDEQLSPGESIYTPMYCDSPPARRLSSEHDRTKSSSEISSGFPPLGPSRGKTSLPGSRRSSMSALEVKSYNEAGWAREPRNDNTWLKTFGSEKSTGRRSTDLTSGLPPLGPSRGKASSHDFRRRSLSALDNERLKLETEVKWLREKLKIVHKGREKLSTSVEHKDREKVQFKLLDDIASQLQEIRQLTKPGKAAREAILPPPSKVKSKKRRCRSASLEVPRK